jgi:hypothetical protein
VRTAAAFLVLAAAASAPCLAQETQQEIAERLFREQQDQRRNALDKVMTAPARAFDHADSDPYHTIDLTETPRTPSPAPAAKPLRSKVPGGSFPWVLVACLLPIIPLAILGFEKARKWWREMS